MSSNRQSDLVLDEILDTFKNLPAKQFSSNFEDHFYKLGYYFMYYDKKDGSNDSAFFYLSLAAKKGHSTALVKIGILLYHNFLQYRERFENNTEYAHKFYRYAWEYGKNSEAPLQLIRSFKSYPTPSLTFQVGMVVTDKLFFPKDTSAVIAAFSKLQKTYPTDFINFIKREKKFFGEEKILQHTIPDITHVIRKGLFSESNMIMDELTQFDFPNALVSIILTYNELPAFQALSERLRGINENLSLNLTRIFADKPITAEIKDQTTSIINDISIYKTDLKQVSLLDDAIGKLSQYSESSPWFSCKSSKRALMGDIFRQNKDELKQIAKHVCPNIYNRKNP